MGEFIITTSIKKTYNKNTNSNSSINGVKNHYYFHLEDERGRIILVSEAFNTKAACENGILLVKENVWDDNKFFKKQNSKAQFYFNLLNCQDIIIGSSNIHETLAASELAILSVKLNAPKAKIVEEI
jgi:uncharacterized protein